MRRSTSRKYAADRGLFLKAAKRMRRAAKTAETGEEAESYRASIKTYQRLMCWVRYYRKLGGKPPWPHNIPPWPPGD